MKNRQIRRAFVIVMSSLAMTAALCSCGESGAQSDESLSSLNESISQPIGITSLAIANKDALMAAWKAGEEARTIEIAFEPSSSITVESALASGDLSIASSNPDVVSVSGLTLSAVSVGSATITASYKNLCDDSVTISVGQSALDSISTLDSFMTTFSEKLAENTPSKYGVVRSQTNSKGTVTTSQILVERRSKELLIDTDDRPAYVGILGNYCYSYTESSASAYVDVQEATKSNESSLLEEMTAKQTAQLEGGSSLTSGDISIYFKYDKTDELHGLSGEYQVSSGTNSYTVKAGYYIDPANTSYGSGVTYEYTYILGADLLPIKVEATRVYANASNWDFDNHCLAEGGTASFTHTVTFTNFDFSEPKTTSQSNPLFDVTPYFITSIDSDKVHAMVLNSTTYQYEEVTSLVVGDSCIISLDDDAFMPATALDENAVYVTAVTDPNVISINGASCKAVGIGECTLIIGTLLHKEMAQLTLTVSADENVGTTDNPVSAYFASWEETTDHLDGTWTTDGYDVSQINLTAGEGKVVELCKTNQTGVVTFDDFNAALGNDASICEIAASDYSDSYTDAGSGYFTITFTPLAAGSTSITLLKSADESIMIPITVAAAK